MLRNAQPPIDFSPLLGKLWHPRALPSDVDGLLEHNGVFLVFECKTPNAPDLSIGQQRALDALQNMHPIFTVVEVLLSGRRRWDGAPTFQPRRARIMGLRPWKRVTLVTMYHFINRWQKWARTNRANEAPDL